MPDLNSIPSNSHGPVAANSPRDPATTNSALNEASTTLTSSPLPISMSATSSSVSALTPSSSPCTNILPSNQSSFQGRSAAYLPSPPPPAASGMSPPLVPGQDNTGVGTGPGPLRHPRPLTAAELHSQLEQEQEQIVNRLSRDLTMLRRAQNSSVVSNTSSTSASTSAADFHSSSFTDSHLLSGPGFPVPTSRRHHRTSSSASSRSLSLLNNQGSTASTATVSVSHSGSAAVLEAARNPRGAAGMSRQNSTTSHRSSSRNRSPQPHMSSSGLLPSSHSQPHGFPDANSGYFNRDWTSSNVSIAATSGSDLSPGLLPATLRYEETIHYRNELEAARRENESLKKRVKALEKILRERKDSDLESGPPRSESDRTSTGVSMTGPTGVGGAVGGGTRVSGGRRDERRNTSRGIDLSNVPTAEMRVGESAASAGTEGL